MPAALLFFQSNWKLVLLALGAMACFYAGYATHKKFTDAAVINSLLKDKEAVEQQIHDGEKENAEIIASITARQLRLNEVQQELSTIKGNIDDQDSNNCRIGPDALRLLNDRIGR